MLRIGEFTGKIIPQLKDWGDDPLWPLKSKRGIFYEKSEQWINYPHHINFNSITKNFYGREWIQKEGEELSRFIHPVGIDSFLHPHEYRAIQARIAEELSDENIRKITLERHYDYYQVFAEAERKKVPHEVFGKFYADKFREILVNQSKLSLLNEENLISPEEYNLGVLGTRQELDRLGFNGFRKMVENNPLLKNAVHNDENFCYPDLEKGERKTSAPNRHRGQYLQGELAYATAEKLKNPDFDAEQYIEEAYLQATSKEYVEKFKDRTTSTGTNMKDYRLESHVIEMPNREIIPLMESADAKIRLGAEMTYLRKHYYAVTDLKTGIEYPSLKGLQYRILNRMREMMPSSTPIEELFAEKEYININEHKNNSSSNSKEAIDAEFTEVHEPNQKILSNKEVLEDISATKDHKLSPNANKEIPLEIIHPTIEELKPNENIEKEAEKAINEVSSGMGKKFTIIAGTAILLGTIGCFIYKKSHTEKNSGDKNLAPIR